MLKRGFTLIELAFAIGIFGIAILGLLALFTASLAQTQAIAQSPAIDTAISSINAYIQAANYETLFEQTQNRKSFCFYNDKTIAVTLRPAQLPHHKEVYFAIVVDVCNVLNGKLLSSYTVVKNR